MEANHIHGTGEAAERKKRIVFIQQMLGQLAVVARSERHELLGYLIDMAYEEARDVLKRPD